VRDHNSLHKSHVEETKDPVIAGSCKVIPVRPWLKGNTIDIIGMFEGIQQLTPTLKIEYNYWLE